MTLTPLEKAILEEYRKAFAANGFPPVDRIAVTNRDNTGSGRHVDLRSDAVTTLEGRTCELPLNVEMQGIVHDLGIVLFLEGGRLETLELFTYTGDWDGEERPWSLKEVKSSKNA